MIYPESLKFLPLYGLSLCKSTPLRGGYADVQLDERCAAGYTMMTLPVKRLLKLLYPSLFRIDEYLIKVKNLLALEFSSMILLIIANMLRMASAILQGSPQADDLKRLPLAAESLDPKGLYVYDDGFRFVIWFGRMLSPDTFINLLGPVDSSVDFSKVYFFHYYTCTTF